MDDDINIENIDDQFEQYKDSDDWEKRTDLAEAYLNIFYEMCYDFACDKLPEDGVEELMPLVERIEVLRGNTSWSLRANVYHILMEQAENQDDMQAIIMNGELSVDSLFRQLKEEKETKHLVYGSLSMTYYTLMRHVPEEAVVYWKKSVHYIKESILDNPANANWILYFNLLYLHTTPENFELQASQAAEAEAFRNWCLSLEDDDQVISYTIASLLIRFRESTNYNVPDDFVFPNEEYYFWLEKSLSDPKAGLSPIETSGAGHFYKKEGARLQRIDLLERALDYFEKTYYEELDNSGFSIYYIADVLEKTADVYKQNGSQNESDLYMTKALEWYEDKQEIIQHNFSLIHHYTEFLERCYHYTGNIQHPSLDFIQSMIKLTEEVGKGYYSGPYLMQARFALHQKQEHATVAFLCKMLLLHELCVEGPVQDFYNDLTKGDFPYVEKFLENTLLFMKEVSKGYCYNPQIKFEKLNLMDDVTVIESWIIRKGEIRKNTNKE